MKTHDKERFISYAIGNFFDTFLVFWLSFLTVGLFNFVDKLPSVSDTTLPDVWMFVYEHIFLFSQWFVPVLLVIFFVNAFFQRWAIAQLVQKIMHAWIYDSVAIIAGALLGSTYLNQGHVFFLEVTLDNQISIIAFSFAFYAVSIVIVSIITNTIQRMIYPAALSGQSIPNA